MNRKKELLQQIKELHGPNYLTLMSITQAVVFGFLVSAVQTDFSVYCVSAWILSATTLLIIIAVWYEYSVSVLVLKWVPDLIDSFMPFCLAVIQLMMIAVIKETQMWFLFSAVFCFSGSLAFINMYIKSRQYDENKEILQIIGIYERISILYPFVACAGFIALYYYYSDSNEFRFSVISSFIYVVFLVRSWLYWRRISKYVHGV